MVRITSDMRSDVAEARLEGTKGLDGGGALRLIVCPPSYPEKRQVVNGRLRARPPAARTLMARMGLQM
jgi:hypothetical protein